MHESRNTVQYSVALYKAMLLATSASGIQFSETYIPSARAVPWRPAMPCLGFHNIAVPGGGGAEVSRGTQTSGGNFKIENSAVITVVLRYLHGPQEKSCGFAAKSLINMTLAPPGAASDRLVLVTPLLPGPWPGFISTEAKEAPAGPIAGGGFLEKGQSAPSPPARGSEGAL